MTTLNQPPYADFAQRFAELLEIKAEGNRSACARALDVTPQAVSKWASGHQLPRGDQMEKLAAWLGTTPGNLRFGDGTKVPLAPASPEFVLMYVEASLEVPLLNDFRLGTERGQKQLLAAANRMEKRPASEWPPRPDKSPKD